jgi:hypothetical protein
MVTSFENLALSVHTAVGEAVGSCVSVGTLSVGGSGVAVSSITTGVSSADFVNCADTVSAAAVAN